MNSHGWYGVVFSLEEQAKGQLDVAKAKINSDDDDVKAEILIATVFMGLAKAFTDGLRRSHDEEMRKAKWE